MSISESKAQVDLVGTSCCKSLHARILAGIVTSRDTAVSAQERLRAVVLWRGDGPIRDGYSLDLRTEARALDDAAERAGRIRLGPFNARGLHGADVSRDGAFIWVMGQQFRLPATDSALVILVDHVDTTPTIDGISSIPGALPAEFWGKSWQSGDTTFIIRPRNAADHLRQALQVSPRARSFLDVPR